MQVFLCYRASMGRRWTNTCSEKGSSGQNWTSNSKGFNPKTIPSLYHARTHRPENGTSSRVTSVCGPAQAGAAGCTYRLTCALLGVTRSMQDATARVCALERQGGKAMPTKCCQNVLHTLYKHTLALKVKHGLQQHVMPRKNESTMPAVLWTVVP